MINLECFGKSLKKHLKKLDKKRNWNREKYENMEHESEMEKIKLEMEASKSVPKDEKLDVVTTIKSIVGTITIARVFQVQ